LRQQQNHEQHFQNLFSTDSEQVMDENLVTILRFEIQSSAFVFLNLQIYNILIRNIWRILTQFLHLSFEEKSK